MLVRFTFVAGVVLTMAGTILALAGIAAAPPFQRAPGSELSSAGFVLFCGAGMFAILTLVGRRAAAPREK